MSTYLTTHQPATDEEILQNPITGTESHPDIRIPKKPFTRVSKRVIGPHGKRSLERGWQKRLAKGWRRVGKGFSCALQLCDSRNARLEERVCDSMESPNARRSRKKTPKIPEEYSQIQLFNLLGVFWGVSEGGKMANLTFCVLIGDSLGLHRLAFLFSGWPRRCKYM